MKYLRFLNYCPSWALSEACKAGNQPPPNQQHVSLKMTLVIYFGARKARSVKGRRKVSEPGTQKITWQ